MPTNFSGFPKECVAFLNELAENNNKPWFEKHKDNYENHVLAPAREFVVELGKRLRKLSPKVSADPRPNKSLFRIHRDTRFSKDKSPYKTHLGIMLWEGSAPRMECSCYYFHLEPPNMMLGVGIYEFSKHLLEAYRAAVVHQTHGKQLAQAVKKVAQSGDFTLGGRVYKKTPRGFDADHPNADFLLFNGLHTGVTSKIPKELYTAALVDYCFERYKKMDPLHKWLVALTERV